MAKRQRSLGFGKRALMLEIDIGDGKVGCQEGKRTAGACPVRLNLPHGNNIAFMPHRASLGAPNPKMRSCSLQGHQPNVSAARSHCGDRVTCCPFCTGRRSHTGAARPLKLLYFLPAPTAFSSSSQLVPEARTLSTWSLLEGKSQPSHPGVVKSRASIPADPAPAACASVMK